MFRALFLLLVPFLTLGAAPVPKEGNFKVRGWGEPTDPLKDCKFDVDRDGKLTLTIPGKGRDLSVHNGTMTGPRVLREIEGDFTIEVLVDGEWALGTKANLEGRPPFFGAGLFVAADDQNYVRLEKAQWESGDRKPCYVSFEVWENSQWTRPGAAEEGELDRTKPARLRLVRKGEVLTASVTQDHKTWKTLPAHQVKFGAKLKVGIGATHTTDAVFKPVFSDLKIESVDAKP